MKRHEEDLKHTLKAVREQHSIYKHIKIGSMVYTESLCIRSVMDGVEYWHNSYMPALLMYKSWTFYEDGYALEFDVVASQDTKPYRPPYNPVYSGFQAQIRGPKYHMARKIKIIPKTDLPFYLHYAITTPLFAKLIKRS